MYNCYYVRYLYYGSAFNVHVTFKEWERGVVLKSDSGLVSVYLMDRGSLRITTARELGRLPEELATFPPLVLPVWGGQGCNAGEEVDGVLAYTDSRLQLTEVPAARS